MERRFLWSGARVRPKGKHLLCEFEIDQLAFDFNYQSLPESHVLGIEVEQTRKPKLKLNDVSLECANDFCCLPSSVSIYKMVLWKARVSVFAVT